jgi:16S rRNA (cytidine1402-2'-O)-methyltransferase
MTLISRGKLHVVGTPIGNLEDMTLRALRVLKEADIVAAEDTRHTRHLLDHFEIRKNLVSYHEFNEAKRCSEFIAQFESGAQIALVSDAGMPGISDPGERLIRTCIEHGIPVDVVPGPSAVLHALVGSGFPIVPFHFGGFLPVKGGARRRELAAARERECTSIYFESPHRLVRALEDAHLEIPGQLCCVARELTKIHEEIRRDTPQSLLEHFREHKPRGEICLVVQSARATEREAARAARLQAGEAECP